MYGPDEFLLSSSSNWNNLLVIDDKSLAEIIWGVPQYFENEFRHEKRLKLYHVVERIFAATGVSLTIACELKTAKDVSDWQYENDEKIIVEHTVEVQENYSIIV